MSVDYIPPDRKRYLTLNAPPEGRFCRIVSLPDDPKWIGLFDGLFSSLVEPWAWRQNGDLTEEEMAEEWLKIYLAQSVMDMCAITPADRPYWDEADGDDAGEEPTDGFPWYEDASDWVVGAFLASSGLGGAGFEFVTIVRQFRLAFRKRDFGAIVDIFLDDDLVSRLDTYSATPDVAYVDIITPSAMSAFSAFADTTHTLRIVHTGTHNPAATPREGQYWLEAIRKRLYAGEVSPSNLRYNEETDEVEYSSDGGLTWTPAPGDDPRHAPKFLFIPVVALDPRCQAAANATQWIEEFIEEVLFMLAAGGVVISLVTLIVALFLVLGPWAIVIGVVFPIAQLIYDAGSTAVSGAMTPEMFNILECILYCHMDEQGQVSAAALADINADIDAQIGGLAAAILHVMFFAMGEVGLSNAGTLGDAAADCDNCECTWCYRFDFTATDGGFAAFADPSYGGTVGSYASGTGWQTRLYPDSGDDVSLQVGIEFPTTYINKIVLETYTASVEGTRLVNWREYGYDASVIASTIWDSGFREYTFINPADRDGVNFQLYSLGSATGTLISATFYGLGECPFGDPNCE